MGESVCHRPAVDSHRVAFLPAVNGGVSRLYLDDTARLSGGSSGGSAITVAEGATDLAIGADLGGSIRVPAARCGVVGHKPTHGLVPYTGIAGIETVAQALTVLAGRDPDDPRQPTRVPTADYRAATGSDPEESSIAVLEEGFTRPDATDAVNERVWAA